MPTGANQIDLDKDLLGNRHKHFTQNKVQVGK